VRPALRRPSPLAGLWVNAAANSFARTVVQLALSWIALELTGSPFMVGVVAAARMAPQIPLGIPAGMLADWVDRRTLVVGVTAASAFVALCVAALLIAGVLLLPAIVAVAVSGSARWDTWHSARWLPAWARRRCSCSSARRSPSRRRCCHALPPCAVSPSDGSRPVLVMAPARGLLGKNSPSRSGTGSSFGRNSFSRFRLGSSFGKNVESDWQKWQD